MSLIHITQRNTVHTTHEASAYTDARMQVCKHAGRHACSARHRHAGSSVCARCAHTLTLTHSHTHTYTHTHTSTHLPRCWRCACQTALRARHSSPRPKQAPPVGRPCRAPRPAPDEDLLPRAGKGLRVSQTLRHQIQHGGPGLGGGGARRAATAAPWSARATRSALVTYAARQGVRCPRCWVCRCPLSFMKVRADFQKRLLSGFQSSCDDPGTELSRFGHFVNQNHYSSSSVLVHQETADLGGM